MVYNKKDFDKAIIQLKPEGFEMVSSFGSTRFVKKEINRTLIIGIGYNEYFPHGAYVKGVVVSIYYDNVEKLMNRLFTETQITNLSGDSGTISRSLFDIGGINYSVFETEISNNETFGIVALEIKKLIDKAALPFFEDYKTLQKVFEDTEKMEIERMANFIGQPLPFRRMIIKKLCNDSRYDDYYNMVVDFYKNENSKDDVVLAEHLNKILLSS